MKGLRDGCKGTVTLPAEDNHGFLRLFVSFATSHAAEGPAGAEATLPAGFRARTSHLERAEVMKEP